MLEAISTIINERHNFLEQFNRFHTTFVLLSKAFSMISRSLFFAGVAAAAPFTPAPGSSVSSTGDLVVPSSTTISDPAPVVSATCTASPRSIAPIDATDSILLPWAQAWVNKNAPRINLIMDGIDNNKMMDIQTDTGSTGILLSSTRFTNYKALSEGLATVPHFLSSSSKLYTGKMIPTKIMFPGKSADGKDISATAMVPILAVENLVICPWYDSESKSLECPPKPEGDTREKEEPESNGVQYMGIGFGHGDTKDGMASPSTNVFLNVQSIEGGTGKINQGYVISTKGVQLGLTQDTTRGMAWEFLQKGEIADEPRDWLITPAGITLDQSSIGGKDTCSIDPSCTIRGTVLIDTGLSYSYVRMPKENYTPSVPSVDHDLGEGKSTKVLPDGTRIIMDFASDSCNSTSAGKVSFTIGGTDVEEPEYARPLEFQPERGAYVNTGRNFLNGWDYGFDAVGGRFGLRKAGGAA